MSSKKDKPQQIAELNDLCRTAMGVTGRLVQTAGISALPPQVQSAIRENVERFSDFGAFSIKGVAEKIFWKIDYYAPGLMHGSEDPGDPQRTIRVLTLMLASEY